MGKDLNGRELGTGFSQRADGLYCARKQINKESICLYNTNYEHLLPFFSVLQKESAVHVHSSYSFTPENFLPAAFLPAPFINSFAVTFPLPSI